MVEFLGLVSALRNVIPYTRVTQAFFRNSMNDDPFSDSEQYFGYEMFPEEGHDAKWLYDRNPPSIEFNSEDLPISRTVMYKPLSMDICNHPNMEQPSTWISDVKLARGKAENVDSSNECCRMCVGNPLCTRWSFSTGTCNLITNPKYTYFRDDAVSGNLEVFGRRAAPPSAVILHGTTCMHNNMSFFRRDTDTIYIGRYMLERDVLNRGMTLEESSTMSCAMLVNEVWTPTEWNKKIIENLMRAYGNPNPQVYVVPEAVDTSLFDPSRVSALNPFRSHAPSNGKPKPFQFLSIFKWEHRKGWDVLLDAYWKSFSKDDNVVLRLKTFVPRFGQNIPAQNITGLIEDYAQTKLGKTLDELPAIEWFSKVEALTSVKSEGLISPKSAEYAGEKSVDESMTRSEMRELLAAADAFVLPTRGEGWGLPVAEAMAMALPTIVTNHSGG